MCGLDVPEAKLENFSKTGSTFLIKRFDRDGEKRIHFASAMTLLGKNDDVRKRQVVCDVAKSNVTVQAGAMQLPAMKAYLT